MQPPSADDALTPGPGPARGFASPADLAACRELLRTGSRTFFAASLLLPEGVREPVGSLYAFCRLADDAVDLGGGNGMAALDELHRRLDLAYRGRPEPIAVDRALADVVARFAIPRALPEALFEGFAWDAEGRRYETLADIEAYAARVAGTVGAMMAIIMGVRAPDLVARACDLGIAMQLTNIARDTGEDARNGRLYLPRAWLREAGIDPDAWLARPAFSPPLGSVVHRLLTAAERLYARADAGIVRLPAGCRPAIRAARLLYAEIGRELERRGLDSVSTRTVVPFPKKARLLARAFLAPRTPAPATPDPPLDAAHFLVQAVAAAPPPPSGWAGALPEEVRPWNLGDRALWVLDLFERLERRKRSGSGA